MNPYPIVDRAESARGAVSTRADSPMARVRDLHLRDHRRTVAIVAPALRSTLAWAVHRSDHDRVGLRGVFPGVRAVADSTRHRRKSRARAGAGMAVARFVVAGARTRALTGGGPQVRRVSAASPARRYFANRTDGLRPPPDSEKPLVAAS